MNQLRHNKEILSTDDRMQPMSYATIKRLQQENRDIKTELNSRYGGKQYEI